jgi:hypothetical protein
VVYSIGRNEKDDGGLEPKRKSGPPQDDDVTFIVER